MSAWNKLTQKEVLERFKKVHGDEYDYSHVEYVNAKTKIKIRCKKDGHRVFLYNTLVKFFVCIFQGKVKICSIL